MSSAMVASKHKKKVTIWAISIAILIVSGLAAYDFARKAQVLPAEQTAWLKSSLIAHRGLHNQQEKVPENTRAAFVRAMEKGYIIELDVSLTKDQELVVYHDKKLKRLLGVDRYLKDIDYQELSQFKIPGSQEKIPLFSEVLAWVDGKVPLLIEVKNEGQVGVLESLLYDELKNYHGKYAIQSFNPYTLKWFRQNAPQILRGQLAGSFIVSDYEFEYAGTTRLPWYKRIVLQNLLLNFESRPNFIAYEVQVNNPRKAYNLKKLGVPLLGWTVKDKETYEKVKDIYDNLIADPFLE